jgi:hypothetical protein
LYAPDVNLKGAIGYGPVTSVEETLDDAVNGANINWFGPYVLTSYQDWYKRTYPVDKILISKWVPGYKQDSLRLCIDQVNTFWPNNIGANRSSQMYTPEFSAVARGLNIAADRTYRQFSQDMAANIVGNVYTKRPKLINHGQHDNVVLPSQSQHALERMCSKGNIASFKRYDTSPYATTPFNPSGGVDHYQTMSASFKDTLEWMAAISAGKAAPSSCR